MSWDLLKRFIESDVFNQNPFLSVAYLSYVACDPYFGMIWGADSLADDTRIMLAFIMSSARSFDNLPTKRSNSFCPNYATL